MFGRLHNYPTFEQPGPDLSIVKLNISNLHWAAIKFRRLCRTMEILKSCSFIHYLIKNFSLSQLVWCQNSLKLTCTILPIQCTVAMTWCHLKVITRLKRKALLQRTAVDNKMSTLTRLNFHENLFTLSQLFLRRIPLGPVLSVHLREVSVL